MDPQQIHLLREFVLILGKENVQASQQQDKLAKENNRLDKTNQELSTTVSRLSAENRVLHLQFANYYTENQRLSERVSELEIELDQPQDV